MIKIVKGDLLQATESIIAHQVNAQGAMNSGVARQIRQAYPVVFKKYKELVEETVANKMPKSSLLGEVQGIRVDKDKLVVNLFGQSEYGYDGKVYTDTNKLYECFKTVRIVAEREGLSVAMPYMIGCFRGGADWKIVEDHLLKAFDGYEVTLYKYHEG